MEKTRRDASAAEWISLLLLFGALSLMQVLVGGTRMVFSLPSYALVGVAGLFGALAWRRVKPAPSPLCLAAAALFCGYILIRAWFSPVPYIARSDVYSVLGGLAVYFLVACVLTGARQRLVLVGLLLGFALAHVAVGAVQFRDGANFMPISWLQRYDYGWRASGFYVCPNHLAGLLEVLGVMGLSIACWSRWPVWAKLLIGYAVAMCYVGLILTGSRGGYLSTVTSLVVFGLLSVMILRRLEGKMSWIVGGLGALAAVILGLLVVFYVGKNELLKGRAQNTFETSNMRIELWKAALQEWKLKPLIGTGSATYLYYGRFFRSEQMQLDPIYTHNDYLQLLAEYGLFGMAGLAIFLGFHFWHGWRNFGRLGPKRVNASQLLPSNALALNIGAIAAVSSYLVHSIFDFNLHIPANVLLLAFVFGILANDGVARGERPSADGARGRLAGRAAGLACSVILLVQCVRLLPGEYFSERARMAVRDGAGGVALLYARRGLETDPGNPDLHSRLGSARLLFADDAADAKAASSYRKAAITELERALALAPREQIYGLELAAALDADQQFEKAENVFQTLIENDPRSVMVRAYHGAHRERWQSATATKENGASVNLKEGAF